MAITEAQATANPLEYLGRDIKLSGTDIAFGSGNDFAFITFKSNLAQAIKMRLLTTVGEYTRHTNYGSLLPDMVSQQRTANTLNKVKEAIRAALIQEPRIEKVNQITAKYDTNNQITVNINIKPINEKDNLNLIYNLFQ